MVERAHHRRPRPRPLPIKDERRQLELANEIVARQLSVREVEARARDVGRSASPSRDSVDRSASAKPRSESRQHDPAVEANRGAASQTTADRCARSELSGAIAASYASLSTAPTTWSDCSISWSDPVEATSTDAIQMFIRLWTQLSTMTLTHCSRLHLCVDRDAANIVFSTAFHMRRALVRLGALPCGRGVVQLDARDQRGNSAAHLATSERRPFASRCSRQDRSATSRGTAAHTRACCASATASAPRQPHPDQDARRVRGAVPAVRRAGLRPRVRSWLRVPGCGQARWTRLSRRRCTS